MIVRNVIVCVLFLIAGIVIGVVYTAPIKTKPLWINQEIRERVFLACSRGPNLDCGKQAKLIATVGNDSGEILFRPREDK